MSSTGNISGYSVHVIRDGFANWLSSGDMEATCTIVLLCGPKNIIIDPGSAWDKQILLDGIKIHGIESPSQIDYVICTHNHTDHIGNLNLFPNATHIVGFEIKSERVRISHDFMNNISFEIDNLVEVIAAPGHTAEDVVVLVKNVADLGTVAIAGDLFECEGDLHNQTLWREMSDHPNLQDVNRRIMLNRADYIVPGHGPMFKVKPDYLSLPSVQLA